MEELMNQMILSEMLFFTSILFLGGVINTIQCFLKKGWGKIINILQMLVFGGMITLYPLMKYSGSLTEFKFASIFVFGFMSIIELLEASHVWHERKFYLFPEQQNKDEESKSKPKGLRAKLTEKREVNREENKIDDEILQSHNVKLFWAFFNLLFNALLTFLSVIIYIGGM
jgi:hypothetical protein